MSGYSLETLLKEKPQLHRHGDGSKASWGAGESVLRFITEHAGPGSKTIETGGGHSTVAFALTGAEHHVVFPEPYLQETITEYLTSKGLPTNQLHFHLGGSQDVLPGLDVRGFDLALIDGEHAFPMPFLDWYYLGKRMKAGGHLIIDDTQIWTGQVLRNFLNVEPEWRLVKEVYGTVFFQMVKPWVEKWWGKQNYTVLHSILLPDYLRYLPEGALAVMTPIFDKKE